MHRTSGRWQLGFLLAFFTALLWGLLPIALKGLLTRMDASTVTWYRFLLAAICIGSYLLLRARSNAHSSPHLTRSIIGLFSIAILGLTANYIFYLKGLEFSTPSSTQVVIQLAPMLLLFGGLIIFKERFNRKQWLGLLLFSVGILLFFNQQLIAFNSVAADYILGILLVALAAIAWAAYALAQKQLLVHFNANKIMLCIYLAGSLIFLPLAAPQQVLLLDQQGWWLLSFCCANTLLAYGCFAEALNHLEASRVSAVLAITPIITIVLMHLIEQQFPGYLTAETLNFASIVGAGLMVFGSMLTALSKRTMPSKTGV